MTLDVPLSELDAQRLHQGLSETILVNTLTDVRELKNDVHICPDSVNPQRGHPYFGSENQKASTPH